MAHAQCNGDRPSSLAAFSAAPADANRLTNCANPLRDVHLSWTVVAQPRAGYDT